MTRHHFPRSLFLILLLAITATVAALAAEPPGALRVRTDFPGGSAKVEALEEGSRTIRLSPTAHPDKGWLCWWYFKLEGIHVGETITLDVGTDPFAKPDRAFYSLDGSTWKQTTPGERKGDRIVYRQRVDAPEAWFAWGPPFVSKDAQALIASATKRSPAATAFELCKSREGRSVPALRISEGERAERYGVWISARQHAWESGSSWVEKGMIEWLLSADPRAETLRKEATFFFVPIMDVDNVERGAGGKNQKPHDHNRDWTDEPYWPEVKAAQKLLTTVDSYRSLDLFIDLHNPAPNDREPQFFLPPRDKLAPRAAKNLDEFLSAALTEMTGPLTYRGKNRETGPNYDPNWTRISGNWVSQNSHGHVVPVCLETAWNTPNSTPEGYQQIGRELGLAIERYFRKSPRP
jgi:hypothetical protein